MTVIVQCACARSLRDLKQKDLYQVLDEIKSRSANLLASQLAIGRESESEPTHTSREADSAHAKPANRSVSAASSRSGKAAKQRVGKGGKRKALEAEDVELDPYSATQKKHFNDALEYRSLFLLQSYCIL